MSNSKNKKESVPSSDFIRELLPIGSVVLCRNHTQKLMIIGVMQIDTRFYRRDEYDYVGVLYPQGYIGESSAFMFNHTDIAEVISRGYEDIEREEHLRLLMDMNSANKFYKRNN